MVSTKLETTKTCMQRFEHLSGDASDRHVPALGLVRFRSNSRSPASEGQETFPGSLCGA